MKPIQTTPELSGKDVEKVFHQVNVTPIEKVPKKSKELSEILNKNHK